MVFTVLCLSQLGQALAVRSDERTLAELGLFTNPQLLGAVVLTTALQLAVVYLPWCNGVFKTAPLSAPELFLALGLSSVVFAAVEAQKLLRLALARK